MLTEGLVLKGLSGELLLELFGEFLLLCEEELLGV